ncbi:hypothetical protein CMO92_01545 [Candidatus Woesearchaeota archaeon]|nr:hypothetical protein [Candidatus Woesearchaeota archaeon]
MHELIPISMPHNILITGLPKCGKSTLLELLMQEIDPPKKGFLTREMREQGQRTGFKVIPSEGPSRTLATIHAPTPIKVSRYYINIPEFEKALPPFNHYTNELLYIDEIG